MTAKETALAFIERFCSADLDGLERLLAPDLAFTGPLLQSGSAAEYIRALRFDPPEPAPYRIDLVQEESEKVFIKWSWHKSTGHLALEQSFEISDGRIRAVRLELCSG